MFGRSKSFEAFCFSDIFAESMSVKNALINSGAMDSVSNKFFISVLLSLKLVEIVLKFKIIILHYLIHK